jgi:hypothetical protein
LPFFVIAAVLLFIVPSILKKKSSGPSAKTRAAQTIDAANLVDAGEQSFQGAHGKYTSHLADLVTEKPALANDLGVGLTVQLDVSSDGKGYVAQLDTANLSLVRSRTGAKLVATCTVIKSASGVKCPVTAAK